MYQSKSLRRLPPGRHLSPGHPYLPLAITLGAYLPLPITHYPLGTYPIIQACDDKIRLVICSRPGLVPLLSGSDLIALAL